MPGVGSIISGWHSNLQNILNARPKVKIGDGLGMFDEYGRRRSHPEQQERIMYDRDKLFQDIGGRGSSYSGLFDAEDIRKRFGFSDPSATVAAAYAPAKRALATTASRARSSMANRLGGNVAVPEASFGALEGEFANASGNLAAQEGMTLAGQKQNQEALVSQILNSVLGRQDEYGFQQANTLNNILNARGMDLQMLSKVLAGEDQGTFWDDLGAGMDLASKIASIIAIL